MEIKKVRSIGIKWIFVIIISSILIYDFLSFLSIYIMHNNFPQESGCVFLVLTVVPHSREEAYK